MPTCGGIAKRCPSRLQQCQRQQMILPSRARLLFTLDHTNKMLQQVLCICHKARRGGHAERLQRLQVGTESGAGQGIARHQASVRPGEPPYRPQIRFRVRPDGLRSYYLAYPALESLRVPMSRENVESGEAARTKSLGR